jgi:hypothetical protein
MLQNQDYYRIIQNHKNREYIKMWIESKTEDDGFVFKNIEFKEREFICNSEIEIEIVAEYGRVEQAERSKYTFAVVFSDNKVPMVLGHYLKRLKIEIRDFKAFLGVVERKRKIDFVCGK